ncbi:MAG: helix-turn-helix domain-containing protein, partial [Gammaproteobacteria bacterium]
ARHLHMSERSLQCRLEQEGQSFSAIRDAARRKRLERLLGEPGLALKEIAYLLGYEERGMFDACMRWFGLTPAVLRARLLANGAAE